jgi:hypothetical protein
MMVKDLGLDPSAQLFVQSLPVQLCCAAPRLLDSEATEHWYY